MFVVFYKFAPDSPGSSYQIFRWPPAPPSVRRGRLIEGSRVTNHPLCISLFIVHAYSPPPYCSSCPPTPHPPVSPSLLSHKQQSCQTAGPPKRAARWSTSEHWKPATGAMKYIKSFPSKCTCTFTCSRKCSVCVCVCVCLIIWMQAT